MFDAQLLISKGTGANAYSILGPWMPRRGDNLTVTAEIEATSVGSGGGNILKISVLTKKAEDPGDGTLVSGSVTLSDTALRASTTFSGTLNDLVRYKYEPLSADGSWMLFRMLSPVWFDSV